MALKTERFVSKSYPVEKVDVTEQNINAVAAWCHGVVHVSPAGQRREGEKYIKVRVHLPRNTKQTEAYVGDIVLYAGKGFKVYSRQAFLENFEPMPRKRERIIDSSSNSRVFLVDLNTWVPGDDVDSDEEVRIELQHYRSLVIEGNKRTFEEEMYDPTKSLLRGIFEQQPLLEVKDAENGE